jgi:hypothetical protein
MNTTSIDGEIENIYSRFKSALGAEALDTDVVTDYLAEKILFRYYRVIGAQLSITSS